jgi:hypothetical protein
MVSASPAAASISAAYSRIVSSIANLGLRVARLVDPDEALVDERAQSVEHVHAEVGRRPAHDLRHVEAPATAEDGQAVDESAGTGLEQVVAPGDRPAQRLLALREVARSGRQQREMVLEAGEDLVGRQQLDAGGGELDRKRHAVQARCDACDGGGVRVRDLEIRTHRAGTGDEQPHGLELIERLHVEVTQRPRQVQPVDLREAAGIGWGGQPRHRVFLLAGDPQRDARGDETGDVRAAPQQVGHDGTGRHDLLEVVEDEQHPVLADVLGEHLDRGTTSTVHDTQRASDRRGDEGRVADRFERHEPDAVGESIGRRGRELEREPCLARAARAGQRDEPGAAQQRQRLGELPFPAHEGRQLGGQVVRMGVERTKRRELGSKPVHDELGEPLRRAEVLEAMLAKVAQPDAFG